MIQENEQENSGLSKFNVPCKYFLTGTCRLGNTCRFLHEKPTTNVRKINSLQNLKSNLDQVSLYLLSRKPLLHLIVLFAADVRVRKYAEELEEIFIGKGINCFMQLETETQDYIKPENLLDIITASSSDYLVVVGDKNMKNRSCHTKKFGKLVEISVDERMQSILAEWPQNYTSKNDLLSKNVNDLSKPQVIELIQSFTNVKHITDRFARLKKVSIELKKFVPTRKNENQVLDERLIENLTTSQNACIRLHKDLTQGLQIIKSITVNDTFDQKGFSLSPSEKQEIGITLQLKEKLVTEISSLLPQVEKFGSSLSELTNHSSLWEAYVQDLKKNPTREVEVEIEPQRIQVLTKKEDVKKKSPVLPKKEIVVKEVKEVKEVTEVKKALPSSVGWATQQVVPLQKPTKYEEEYPSLIGKKKRDLKESFEKELKPEPKVEIKETKVLPKIQAEPIPIQKKDQFFTNFPPLGNLERDILSDVWDQDDNDEFEIWSNNKKSGTLFSNLNIGSFSDLKITSKSPQKNHSFNFDFHENESLFNFSKVPTKPNTPTFKTLFVDTRQRNHSDAVRPSNIIKPCKICGNESSFECNFCSTLKTKGVEIDIPFFCTHCLQGYKDHQKVHEKLSVEYKMFL